MFSITVDENITLHLLQEHHAQTVFDLIDTNRAHLAPSMGSNLDATVIITKSQCLLAKKQFAETGALFMLITYNGQPAGMINMQDRTGQSLGGAEIGYWLGEDFIGHGIITRATKTLTDYAFTYWDVQKVLLGIAPDNERSIAVATRLNFAYEGTLRQNDKLDDHWIDRRIYAIIRDDWQPPHSPPILRFQLDNKLDLRPVDEHHAQVIFDASVANREHLNVFLPWMDSLESVADTMAFIQTSRQQYGKNDGWQASIWYDNQFVGMIGYLFWNTVNDHTEIGYWLTESATGHGIMTRCAREFTRYAFEVLRMNRVVISCAVANKKSATVAQRLGFTHERIKRQGIKLNNTFTDVSVYSLLAEEWQTQ